MKSFIRPYVVFVFFIFLNHCIGDLYFDTVNEMNDSKIPRSEALRQFYAAVLVKRTLCPNAEDYLFNSAVFNTSKKASGCDSLETNKKSEKNLQSCESMFRYVKKKDVSVCLSEVLFVPCESFEYSSAIRSPQLNFPVCRGLFGPGGASKTTM